MTITHPGRALALVAVALAAPAFAAATNAGAAHEKHASQRLVVRGDATIADGPCIAGVCKLQLTDGSFRGTPVGTRAYSGTMKLSVADAFPNGEGGVCAPIQGH